MAESPPKDHVTHNAHGARDVLPTAPELPMHIARQYGLHEHNHAAAEVGHEPVAAMVTDAHSDRETNAAVDDIAAHDSDALLQLDTPAPIVQLVKRGFWARLGRPFAWWWRHKWLRYATIVLALAGLAATAAIPGARYAALNTLGVRSEASVLAVDSISKMPLKNVTVTLAGQTVKTNVDGKATFVHLKLGPTQLQVRRVAFASITEPVTVGWGSNPLGSYALTATGVQYPLQVIDFLSGKPVYGAEVVSDEANALSNRKGAATITVEDTLDTTLAVTVQAMGYRTEALTLNAEATAPAKVSLVPANKHAFVTKQSGKYDLYTIDLDGKNKSVLLAGTGIETSNLSVAANATSGKVALASTRDDVRDKDGYLLTTLTLVDVKTGAKITVERGAQIQLLAWMGDRLVYRVAVGGASAANPARYRLMAYNADTNAKLQLSSANEFTASYATRGYVYYAASSADPKAVVGLFKIKPDGSGKKQVFGKEVWTALRTSYDGFVLQTPNEWYSYDIPTESAAVSSIPANFTDFAYNNDSTDQRSIFLDKRDGLATLLLHDIKTTKQVALVSQDGITQPLHWAGNHAVIYRVAIGGETADYAVSPDGGTPRKIADVIVTYGATTQ